MKMVLILSGNKEVWATFIFNNTIIYYKNINGKYLTKEDEESS